MTPELTAAVSFERAVAVVLFHEGGAKYHFDDYDPGGETRWGISMRFAGSIGLDVDGDGKTTNHDIEVLTRREAVEIYRKHFWLPLRCPELRDPGLALMVFDGAVNQGCKTMARRLQRAAGADDDGIVGPQTIAAVKEWRDRGVVAALIDEVASRRMRRYAQTRNFKRYGLGWSRRLMAVHNKAVSPWRP